MGCAVSTDSLAHSRSEHSQQRQPTHMVRRTSTTSVPCDGPVEQKDLAVPHSDSLAQPHSATEGDTSGPRLGDAASRAFEMMKKKIAKKRKEKAMQSELRRLRLADLESKHNDGLIGDDEYEQLRRIESKRKFIFELDPESNPYYVSASKGDAGGNSTGTGKGDEALSHDGDQDSDQGNEGEQLPQRESEREEAALPHSPVPQRRPADEIGNATAKQSAPVTAEYTFPVQPVDESSPSPNGLGATNFLTSAIEVVGATPRCDGDEPSTAAPRRESECDADGTLLSMEPSGCSLNTVSEGCGSGQFSSRAVDESDAANKPSFYRRFTLELANTGACRRSSLRKHQPVAVEGDASAMITEASHDEASRHVRFSVAEEKSLSKSTRRRTIT